MIRSESTAPTLLQTALLGALLALAACTPESSASLIDSGKKASGEKQYSAAVIQFKRALEKDPKSAEARYLLGQALLEAGDPGSAALELSKALEGGYPREKVLPPLAEAMFGSGDFKKLTAAYGAEKLSDPLAESSLKSWLATAWLVQNEPVKSEQALQAALAATPDFGPAKLIQAQKIALSGDLPQALAAVNRIVANDPKLFYAWMFRGQLLAQSGDGPAADDSFAKTLALEPRFAPAHTALVARRLIANDVKGAETQLAAMQAALPKHPATTLAEAQMAYVKKDFPKSRELVQQLLRVDPDNLGGLQLSGAIEAQIGSVVLAETQFTKALGINPDLQGARLNLGQNYLRLGQPAKTLETLQPLLQGNAQNAQAHGLAAQAQLLMGNAGLAEAEFKRAAALDPADSKAAVALALTRLDKGEGAAGLADLQALTAKTQDIYPDLALVSTLIKRGDPEGALAAIGALDRKHPNDATIADMRGRVLLSQQKLAAAREAFEQALKLDPAQYATVAQLASLDILEGKPEQARQRYEASIKADPANFYPRLALAALQRRLREPVEAVEATLNAATSASPNAAQPRLMLIDFLLRQRRYKDALAQANSAASALPNDTVVLDAAGRAAALAGSLEQAANTFRRLASLQPNSAVPWLRLAELYKADNRRDAAETALKKAVEVEPQNTAANQALLDLLVGSKREAEAIQIGQARQRQQPKDPAGYLFEAVTLARLKKTDAAIAVMRKGLKNVTEPADMATVLYAMLGSAGRDAEAERFAAEWLKEHPNDAAFDYQVSAAQLQRGEYAKAEVRLVRILAAHPDNALALNNMAWVLLQTGRPGALPYAQRAVELFPNDATSLDTLAGALAADKQYARALEVQRQAIDLAPANSSLRLTLARIAIQAGDKALATKELSALQALGAKFPAQDEVAKLQKTL